MKSPSRLFAVAAVSLTLAAATLLALPGVVPEPNGEGGKSLEPKGDGMRKASWKEVERLVGEQKLEEAREAVEKIRKAARATGNGDDWTKALIREVQLRTALHGYETSVRFLKDEPWPDGFLDRTALDLFYAHSLVTYVRAYGWEIGKRERVESKGVVDLRAWTRDQIWAEAGRAFADVWKQRDRLGREPASRLADFIQPNTFPDGIRPSLRDAVTYLYVDFLADQSGWRPEESNELYRLDAARLVKGEPGSASLDLADPAIHPLRKVSAVLGDLASWHARGGKREAELEALLERFRRLHAAIADPRDQEAIGKELERTLGSYRSFSWWATGKAVLAEFVRAENTPGNLVRARAIADEGAKAYPGSPGGERCRSMVLSIEAPGWQMSSMSSDGQGERSVLVTHRNLPALHFRAFSVDLESHVSTAADYGLLPDQRDAISLLQSRKADVEWKTELPATPDFKDHSTYVVPPLSRPGLWVVVGSPRPDFSEHDNQVTGVDLIISDLVLAVRSDDGGGISVRALSGSSGRPVAGAEVALWRRSWRERNQKVETRRSGPDGNVLFPPPSSQQGTYFFLLGKRGSDLAIDSGSTAFTKPSPENAVTASLVYTDRSVYRPQQKVFWKVLAYRGKRAEGRLAAYPEAAVTVSLVDPNGEMVESKVVKTGSFGTAAGEFVIPTGRLLGAWRVQSSLSGSAVVKVEEYKRPTFEVSFEDAKSPLRLGRPAVVRGVAKYYFGLPVSSGTVKWRVTRQPVFPWWWGWYGGSGQRVQAQTVAAGTSTVKDDGTFEVAFTPEADERAQGSGGDVSFRFLVAADVTDEGGETRSASRSVRLGTVSVEARIDLEHGFLREAVPGEATIIRTNLDGAPRSGEGTFRLVRLVQPEKGVVPSEIPLPLRPAGDFETPGDRLRPRWAPDVRADLVMREWKDGAEVARGVLGHDAKGEAKAHLGKLAAGAYRLRYATVDDFGARYETSREFVVGGARTPLSVPILLETEERSVPVGKMARILAVSGIPGQVLTLEIYRNGRLDEERDLGPGEPSLIEIPVTERERGGFGIALSGLRDHQFFRVSTAVLVPWDDKKLSLEFATFRDKMTPGAKETFTVKVKTPDGKGAEAGAAELLAYMYDRSLDIFAPHTPPGVLSLYPTHTGVGWVRATLGQANTFWIRGSGRTPPSYPTFLPDRLKFYEGYGIGGPGRRGMVAGAAGRMSEMAVASMPAPAAPMKGEAQEESKAKPVDETSVSRNEPPPPAAEAPVPLRSDFAETAFWRPNLLTGPDGTAEIEFTVPDSVTSWKMWVHAVTRDLKGGSIEKETRSVKELMVRPYLPRFLREGDTAEVKVLVNNASAGAISGTVTFDAVDPGTNGSLNSAFGLEASPTRSFTAAAGGGAGVTFHVTAPRALKLVAFKVTATSGTASDGELRPIPVLPGRLHLVQSRFVTLKNRDLKKLTFADMARDDDPTRTSEQLVVTVDAQLFYTVLQALPYLVNFPYECTEQTLNRFVSTGIVSSLYKDYPAVSRMAEEMSRRQTRLEPWDQADPNRKMALEESPWLETARGGKDMGLGLTNVLDPRIAKADRDASLLKLRKAQNANGSFPWWPGGPPSPYMTLYIMHGFANAAEFGVDVPKDMIQRGWQYLASHYREDLLAMKARDCCWEFLTFLGYVASSYPDDSYTGDALTMAERKEILDFSFKHWKQHSPYLKGLLALTLKRMGRPADAKLVWDSVMDSARTNDEQGTFWAPEERSWLWYNDTVETQAFALRTLTELAPSDSRREGLVQWLLLNKKLNQWKSTRATAEVVYALAGYLKKEGALGIPEDATVILGPQKVTFTFEPDRYTGGKNQVVVQGDKVDPRTMSTIVVEKESKGFAFASAAWSFATDRLPAEGSGDFFSVSRSYFKRELSGKDWVLRPLAEGAEVKAGDQVEVQLSLRSKHAAEYVHLRDPRGAGFEPENPVSRYRWDLGISWYEEIRDSGTNFFFEQLPAGEYTFKYRIRAATAGTFRTGPATVQSMYAPEFNAYSAGNVLSVR